MLYIEQLLSAVEQFNDCMSQSVVEQLQHAQSVVPKPNDYSSTLATNVNITKNLGRLHIILFKHYLK